MFKTNIDKMVKGYNKKLNDIGQKGIPIAATFTLNDMASRSMKFARKNFERDRVIRASWATRGILFQQTRQGIPIRKMESRSGSIRDFGDIQEHGGSISANNKFIPIPALGARIGKNKRKRIAKKFSMPQLSRLRRMPNVGGSSKRRFASMLNIAREEKYYGPFLVTKKDAAGSKLPVGIFNLSAAGRGKTGGGKITMIRKLQKTVKVPGNPYIQPAGAKVGKRMDRLYIKNAKIVLARFGRDVR